MAVKIVVGAQWGDEGKGKIVDILSAQADVVARYQGGANAGHTIKIKDKQYILHLIPSGILHEQTVCIVGNGLVVDPAGLLEEIQFLREKNIHVDNRLFISEKAHVIFSYHKKLDQLKEAAVNSVKIGTTGRGIGPAYSDKINRLGIRFIDYMNDNVFRKKLKANIDRINVLLTTHFKEQPLNFETVYQEAIIPREALRPFVTDTSLMLYGAINKKQAVLLEGAQGTLLDVDHGTYPFVTSSNPVSGGACSGLGIGPTAVNEVVGVLKAYTTRVGEGPFPSELSGEAEKYFREIGQEFGATTGRPRRCGWFDLVLARYAVRVNGLTQIALTTLDILDQLHEIEVCEKYEIDGNVLTEFPADMETLRNCKPIYKSFPGWKKDTSEINNFDDLPENAKNYIRYIEKNTGTPVTIISVGAARKNTIYH